MSGGDAPEIEETPEERELARIGAERLSRYFRVFRPAEQKFMDMVRQDESDHRFLRSKTSAAVSSAFNDAKQEQRQQFFSQGVDPSSSVYNDALNRVAKKYGSSLGFRKTDADQGVTNLQIAGLRKIVDMGRGVSNDAVLSYQDMAADAASQAATDASNTIKRRNSNVDTAFGLMGLGTGIYSNRDEIGKNDGTG